MSAPESKTPVMGGDFSVVCKIIDEKNKAARDTAMGNKQIIVALEAIFNSLELLHRRIDALEKKR
jgi:hypothetical protein